MEITDHGIRIKAFKQRIINKKILDGDDLEELQELISDIYNNSENPYSYRDRYEIIQLFREKFSNEPLKYRIGVPIKFNGEKKTIVLELTGEAFMDYLSEDNNKDKELNFSNLGRVAQTLYQSSLKKNQDEIFKQYEEWGIIYDSGASEFYDTMFNKMVKGQYLIPKRIKTEKGYQTRYAIKGKDSTYNRGTIFEQFDKFYQKNMGRNGMYYSSQNHDERFYSSYLLKQFEHDSSAGSASGDYALMKNGVKNWIENKFGDAVVMGEKQITERFSKIYDVIANTSNGIQQDAISQLYETIFAKGSENIEEMVGQRTQTFRGWLGI